MSHNVSAAAPWTHGANGTNNASNNNNNNDNGNKLKSPSLTPININQRRQEPKMVTQSVRALLLLLLLLLEPLLNTAAIKREKELQRIIIHSCGKQNEL